MKHNGFSLVEMLVVIIIISVLMTLLIPGYISIYTSVKRNSFDSKVKQIETAALKYGNEIKDEIKAETYTKNGINYCTNMTAVQLIQKGYLISDSNGRDEIINPTNGAVMNGNVRVCYSSSKLDIIANYVEEYDASIYYHKGDKVITSSNGKMYECIVDAPPGKLYSDYHWTTTTNPVTTKRIGETTQPTTHLVQNASTNDKYFKEITY
jgi:prepilin-type N-terminal cleavage/methylation domain-containing protein